VGFSTKAITRSRLIDRENFAEARRGKGNKFGIEKHLCPR
jgi:hypothetical protein